MSSTLILGGARSGKSTLAQRLAEENGGEVLFVATAEAGDEDMKLRIAAHRRSRPANWKTLEVTHDIGTAIPPVIGTAATVIIDCITLLVSNIFQMHGWVEDPDLMQQAVREEITGLIDCINKFNAHFIIVSNEVGLGIVPADRLSRIYRDELGRANQMLAQQASKVYLLVAGIPLVIK